VVRVGGHGLLIGEVARRTGASRKALRLYEAARIVTPAGRTATGYRLYGADAVPVVAFVRRAQRLGLTLDEIREIVAIRRSGRAPCDRVRQVVQRKLEDVERRLADLARVRDDLRGLLDGWRRAGGGAAGAAVCPHIERIRERKEERPWKS